MVRQLLDNEKFGLIRPYQDAHTLGISNVGKLLERCGYKVLFGDLLIAEAVAKILETENIALFKNWIFNNKITRLGFSYRLDPLDAQRNFGKLYQVLKKTNCLVEEGGIINQIYFAGLPESCNIIEQEYRGLIPVFSGDETQIMILSKLGVSDRKIPKSVYQSTIYDDSRFSFAKGLILSGEYAYQPPLTREVYSNYGTKKDTIIERVDHNRKTGNLPLIRVHVGPYNPKYSEAIKEFLSWLQLLAQTKFVDIVSIGSSQLSQSNFGEDWGEKPNGGGVPINSKQDLQQIWDISRPLLIRTYAGTKNIPELAKIYEETINIAWHALSFWWFNKIDGRGEYSVKENLIQHYETLKYIAWTGKPFEPNIPHHFSFRGGDDYTYVLSAYLAAKTAKTLGVRYMITQIMFNTPKYTWGVQDLAKARALIMLLRELEDKRFNVLVQPRAGLEYFSSDMEQAKIQLASVTAMMDDIEPANIQSPDIIHVVNYCEAVKLATPNYINESIQITLKSLSEYRRQKKLGNMDNMLNNQDVIDRTLDIYNHVKTVISIIESKLDNPYSPAGLYEIFKRGVMPVPYLWEGREEFSEAVKWKTDLINGGVKVVNNEGVSINPIKRVNDIFNC